MKLTLVALLMLTSLYAEKIKAAYKVTYGIFGEVGIATAELENDGENYYIRVTAKATGLAKVLSGNRVEVYESGGSIEKGHLTPSYYQVQKRSNSKNYDKLYQFGIEKGKVFLQRTNYYKNQTIHDKPFLLDFYANNDLLTLFFNFRRFLSEKQDNWQLQAIGTKHKQGLVDIKRFKAKEREEVKAFLDIEANAFLLVNVHQKIFASKEGELLIALDEQFLAKKAVLKDVIFFGDIEGTRIALTKH